MSSPKTRARLQARLHASQLAKIASDAMEALNMFIENNEEHLTEAPESTFNMDIDEMEEMQENLRKLSESYYAPKAAPIYRGTIHRLGRIEVRCKLTGNRLFTMHPAENVAEYLKAHNFQLSDVQIEWHPEEYTGDD